MRIILTLILALSLLGAAAQALAEEGDKPVVASSHEEPAAQAEPQPFSVIILGTRSGPDIELIRKNVEKLAYVSLFVPASVSQRHLEFAGKYAGEEETLVADIESLSQDRYDVKAKHKGNRGLVITLRKIQPASSTAEE